LQEIKDYLDSFVGFILVLIDIEKIPKNGREVTGTYQGHYLIIYKMDDDSANGFVSVLDPIENEKEIDKGNDKKEVVTIPYKIKIADFEKARLADGTD
jgi:hypothetical protein